MNHTNNPGWEIGSLIDGRITSSHRQLAMIAGLLANFDLEVADHHAIRRRRR